MKKILRELRGFTLIEVMFAVVALTFGLTVLMRSFIIALEGIKRTENIKLAAVLLEEKMEEIKQQTRENEGIEQGRSSGDFDPVNNKNFSWSLEVLKSDAGKTLNEVQLTVMWNESHLSRKLMAQTYLESIKEDEE